MKVQKILVLMISLCLVSSSIGMAEVQKGLVAYWSFDEGKGNIVEDVSGSGNNGTIHGATWITEGKFGSALSFDGKDDYIDCGNDPSLSMKTNNFTVEAWVKPASFPKYASILGSSEYRAMSFGINADGALGLAKIGIMASPSSTGKIPLNTWSHIAAVFDSHSSAKNLKFYINGVYDSTVSFDYDFFDKWNPRCYIGRGGPLPKPYHQFHGLIDEVKIYNRILSAAEIKEYYNSRGAIAFEKTLLKNLDIKILSLMKDLEKKVQLLSSLSPEAKWWVKEIELKLNSLKEEMESSQELSKHKEIELTALQLNMIVETLKENKIKTKHLLAYVVKPISEIKVLPDTLLSPDKISDTLSIIASPGEYEPASFVLYPGRDIKSLRLEATALVLNKGIIPASNIDIKVVKCWYQAGGAWFTVGAPKNPKKKVLVPELLLKDDSLVKVDYEKKENYLKLKYPEGEKYVWISKAEISPLDWPTPEEFPVKDSSSFLPVDISANTNKQFWLTVKVPEDAVPGIYTGKINLSTPKESLTTLTLRLRVLPFKLSKPMTYYDINEEYTSSMMYFGELRGKGSISGRWKTPEQMKAELKNLYIHGVTNPSMIWEFPTTLNKTSRIDNPLYSAPSSLSADEFRETFKKMLKIRKEAGIVGPLYTGCGDSSCFSSAYVEFPDEVTLKRIREKVKEVIKITKEYDIPKVYFYGIDEAKPDERLKAQRPAWKAAREAGGKIYVDGYTARANTSGNFALVGDLQDLLICGDHPSKKEAEQWHSIGHKIWLYNFPAVVENPELNRRNFGLLVWKANYDGACTQFYQDCCLGSSWNDSDSRVYRDHNYTYPTVDGVIDTIAFEGYREGIDDIRYAATLKLKIEKAKKSGNKKLREVALSAEKYLEDLDVNRDLDIIRLEIIRYILKLKGVI